MISLENVDPIFTFLYGYCKQHIICNEKIIIVEKCLNPVATCPVAVRSG